LSVEDIANAANELLKVLDISVLHAVIGPSMGGMSALSFCQLHPGKAKRLVSISSAARSSPFSIALRSLQREIIRNDPGWENGAYDLSGNGPISGMRLARKLGMITYRSAKEWSARFGRERAMEKDLQSGAFGVDFEIESYLESHANKFIGAFDPNCYLYLSRAMDLFDASDPDGNLKNSFKQLKLEEALIIGVETDLLFPISQQAELAEALEKYVNNVQLVRLDSLQGHDSFLVDMDRFRPVISAFI
jgi:homoserine O-acetyltransferase